MKLYLERDGRSETLEVQAQDRGIDLVIDGRKLEADACWIGERFVSLLIEGRSFDLLAEMDATNVSIVGPGQRFQARINRRPVERLTARAEARGERIVSPMPGKVVEVLVKPGDAVKPGQGMVIVEAMKMENELTARAAGVVTKVHVGRGQVVEGGAVLVEVGSLKAAVAAYAERAPAGVRIVGLHPMAGTTASGFGSADPALLRDRPFLVVSTARSDEKAISLAGELARDLGGVVTRCDPAVHDRAMAVVSALPLAVAVALERVARDAVPLPLEAVAGTGFRDATRLAGTSSELALALLAAPGLAGHIAALRSALAEVERSLGSEPALRDLLGKVHR